MRTLMNFLAAYRRPALALLLSTFSAVACASADARPRIPILSPPVLWDGWEAYYHIMHYEGDRSADVQ